MKRYLIALATVLLAAGPAAATIVPITSGTTWTVPADWNSATNTIECIGAAGSSANGIANTSSGASGGSGAYALKNNVALTPGSTITVQVAAAGSASATLLKNNAGSTVLSCSAGTNASGTTAGAGGTASGSTGDTRRSGAAGRSGVAGVSRGGGAGPGSPGPGGLGQVGGASTGTTAAGGGGGSDGGSATAGATAGTNVGGAGGLASDATAGGTGGTTLVVAGDGSGGSGGGGGATLVGANGGRGSCDSTWGSVGACGGGGGGGPGGNGGNGGTYGAAGGGGGDNASTGGTAGTGGQGIIVASYAPVSSGGTLLALGAGSGATVAAGLPSGALHLTDIYGQSWAADQSGSQRAICWPGTTTTFTSLRAYMLNNHGAPGTPANAPFDSTAVTALIGFSDCYGPTLGTKPPGQSLGVQLWYLQGADDTAGRSATMRAIVVGGISGQPMSVLSKGGTPFSYPTGAPIEAYDQNIAMITSACSQASTLYSKTCVVDTVGWLQGWANSTTSASAYQTLNQTLETNLQTDIPVATGQGTAVAFIIEQVVPNGDGTTVPPAIGQLAMIKANSDGHVYTTGPQYYRHFQTDADVTVAGSIANGDSATVTLTSSAIAGSPVVLTIPVITGDTTTTVAAKIATAVNANIALENAGVYATSSAAVAAIYAPGTLQPPFVLTTSNGASITFTASYAVQSAHEVNRDVVWKAEQFGWCQAQIAAGSTCPYLASTSTSAGASSVTITYGLSDGTTPSLVRDITTLPAATNDGFVLDAGRGAVNANTTSGTSLSFASAYPPFVAMGMYVRDVTHPSAIAAGTTVSSASGTTVTLSAGVSSTVSNGDIIEFSTCQRSITGVSYNGATATVTLDGSPTGCTLHYALEGPGQVSASGPLTGYAGGYGNIRDATVGPAGRWSGFPRYTFAMSEEWTF